MSGEIKEAWNVICKAMSKDFDYAWAVHSNIAMPIFDNTDIGHTEANRVAAKIMKHLFDYDVTGLKRYIDLEHPAQPGDEDISPSSDMQTIKLNNIFDH